MRPIKFRAWDRNTKQIIIPKFGTFFECHLNADNEPYIIVGHITEPISYRYNCEIMQFTGLLDKNGKEIFEGDIVEDWRNLKGNMTFYDGAFVAFSAEGKRLEKPMEVIGNIYENPELLK